MFHANIRWCVVFVIWSQYVRHPSVQRHPADHFVPATSQRCTCWPPSMIVRASSPLQQFQPSPASELQIESVDPSQISADSFDAWNEIDSFFWFVFALHADCITHFNTKSSLRRRSSSWSRAELVLLLVTDILCVSCGTIKSFVWTDFMSSGYIRTLTCALLNTAPLYKCGVFTVLSCGRGVWLTQLVGDLRSFSCVWFFGQSGGSRWIVPDFMCQ